MRKLLLMGFSFKEFSDVFLKALGQSIYSLSMGMGVIYIYGSYLTQQSDIIKSTRWIVFLDTFVSFLAGIIVLINEHCSINDFIVNF